jgi:hypothetical protein
MGICKTSNPLYLPFFKGEDALMRLYRLLNGFGADGCNKYAEKIYKAGSAL